MSGERPAEERAAPPVEQAPQGRNAEPRPGKNPEVSAPRPPAEPFLRFILPSPTVSLAGEADERAWSIYLTPAQAQAGRELSFAYQNAIVVAPEASVLSVLVNGKLVGEGAVQAADEPHERSYDIPPGLLRTGENEIRFRARHRHRTDCTIQSTYELWTEIASESAFITFEGEEPRALSAIEDIQAVGTNEAGRTQFNIVAPALEQPSRVPVLMRLAQGVALLGRMNRPLEAAQAFEVALRAPASAVREDAAYGQSLAYLRAGLTSKAAVAATKSPQSRARVAELQTAILADRAIAAFDAGRYRETLIFLDQLRRISTERTDLMVLRGYAYLNLNRFTEAKRIFEAAAATGNRDARRGLADVSREQEIWPNK